MIIRFIKPPLELSYVCEKLPSAGYSTSGLCNSACAVYVAFFVTGKKYRVVLFV